MGNCLRSQQSQRTPALSKSNQKELNIKSVSLDKKRNDKNSTEGYHINVNEEEDSEEGSNFVKKPKKKPSNIEICYINC